MLACYMKDIALFPGPRFHVQLNDNAGLGTRLCRLMYPHVYVPRYRSEGSICFYLPYPDEEVCQGSQYLMVSTKFP